MLHQAAECVIPAREMDTLAAKQARQRMLHALAPSTSGHGCKAEGSASLDSWLYQAAEDVIAAKEVEHADDNERGGSLRASGPGCLGQWVIWPGPGKVDTTFSSRGPHQAAEDVIAAGEVGHAGA